MVSEDEWSHLAVFFEVDHPISVTRNRVASNGLSDADNVLVSHPSVCSECLHRRRQQELDDRLVSGVLNVGRGWDEGGGGVSSRVLRGAWK